MSAPGAPARVFVGLFLGQELGRALLACVGPSLARARFRTPPPESLHLTLVFLGALERGLLEPLGRALGAELSGTPRPTLLLEGTGAFPERGPARVLWAGVGEERPGGLEALQRKVRAALRAAEIELPDERFHPHVTVARPRAGRSRVPEAFARLALRIPWSPSAVDLVESVPGGGASRYEVRASQRLGEAV